MPTDPKLAPRRGLREIWLLLPLFFALLVVFHLPLLRLPYFWDEAGYYIPAARDLFLTLSLIPHSTLSNAHPPLLMAYLALAWKTFGFRPLVTRLAMLVIAAFALVAFFELARAVSTIGVAIASTLCLALYPVFFAQSSLAHLDLAAAALTLWGLLFYLRRQIGWAAFWFTLAALAKETAILAPLALLLWDLLPLSRRRPDQDKDKDEDVHRIAQASPRRRRWWLLFPLVPLAGWFAYHYARTGYIFGNPEFFRYNLANTLEPLRIALQFLRRGWQLVGHMDLFVLTIAAALTMFFAPQADAGEARRRIAISAQLALASVIAAYWLALSFIGGAVLARYLLPVIPLVILICVSTIRRRIRGWPAAIAIVCAAFVAGWFYNPPYVFAPEDNLAYRDYVILHQQAAAFLSQHDLPDRILTAWPASDELARPWLGYVNQAFAVDAIADFTPQALQSARDQGGFDAALVFSTKYEPRYRLPAPAFWRHAETRFFDYHRDASPRLAAQILDGRVVYEARRGGQWVAVIQLAEIRNARAALRNCAAAGVYFLVGTPKQCEKPSSSLR